MEEGKRLAQLIFNLNHTMPMTEEYNNILNELFGERLGEGRFIATPIQMVCADKIRIGKNVFINSNFLAMSRGGITIEDDVQIAANVQVISNNHDPYERQVLLCKPVFIKKGAWIGAGLWCSSRKSSKSNQDVGCIKICVGLFLKRHMECRK